MRGAAKLEPVAPEGRAADAAQRLVGRAAAAQQQWQALALGERLQVIAEFRRRLAAYAGALAARVAGRPPAETLAAEVLPLLECCRFLERRAREILRPARRGGRNPLWLRGTVVEVAREPFGIVLIVGPGNYGLMLAAVQALHALTAGNAVIVKPAPGARALLDGFAALLTTSGLPAGLLTIVDESPDTARRLLERRVDKLVFTGSSGPGRALLAAASARLLPATLELSGWDACIVLDDADLDRVVAALAFGVTLNSGCTCLAPRRVIASAAVCEALERRLAAALAHRAAIAFGAEAAARLPALLDDALRQGARLLLGRADSGESVGPVVVAGVTPGMSIFSTEVFGPVLLISVAEDADDAVRLANQSSFALGVTLFGPEARARALVPRLAAGVAMINDVIVPAGHPEVSLAARGASGFGATRGAEGLLAMTRPKVITASRVRRPFHLAAAHEPSAELLAAYALAAYGGGLRARLRALAAAFHSFRRDRNRRSQSA